MASLMERSGFTGLVTNAAELKAGTGALIEAVNVVIRRPGQLEVRDGVVPESGMNGQELWGFSFANKDYVVRDNLGAYDYRELVSGTPITNRPLPYRRDILTRAEARGNLYIPGATQVHRLVQNATAFDDAGLVMTSSATFSVQPGATVPPDSTGMSGFTGTTYVELPANQGPIPGATYWVAVEFFLKELPPAAQKESLVSRGHAFTGFQLGMVGNTVVAQWSPAGFPVSVSVALNASHVGRTHVMLFGYSGGVGTLWFDGGTGVALASAALANDPTDVTTFGNGRVFGASPLQSAVLISCMSGTATAITQTLSDDFYAEAKLNGEMQPLGTMPATRWWLFSAIPVVEFYVGQVPTITGQIPYLQTTPVLWMGDPAVYPPEFWLPKGYHAGYRLVGYSKDAAGLIRRSAPSQIYDVAFPDTGGQSPGAYVLITSSFTHQPRYDTVEIYRSRAFPIGTQLDDEMQLVLTIPVSGFLVSPDLVPQESRGAVLYTSPSRGGILEQNDPPPACACIAVFKGSLFFGNTRGPATLLYSLSWGGDVTGSATGIGTRQATGTFTNASNQVTGVTPLTGLEPGQKIDTGTFQRYITAIVGSTLTLDSAAPSGGVLPFTATDQLWVGTTPADPRDPSAAVLAALPNTTITQIIPAQNGYGYTVSMVSDSRGPVAAGYTVRATHGGSYSAPLPLYTAAQRPWTQDVFPGGLFWSKPDEPEHVAPINYAFVGEQKKSILGMVPTRDALFILKEDGIWRLTGQAGTWRIDPFDPTTICILPNSVRKLHGRAIFLSRKGVVCVGDAGVEIVSAPINDLLRVISDGILTRFLTSGLYELLNIIGSVSAVFERENEYTMLLDQQQPALVFNQNTGAWTQWASAWSQVGTPLLSLFNFERSDKVVYRISSSAGLTTALANFTAPAASVDPRYRADRQLPVTISGFVADPASGTGLASGTVTLSASPGATYAGDILIDAIKQVWVVTLNSANATLRVESTATGIFGTGAGFLCRSIRCRAVPAAFMDPAATSKHFRSFIAAFPLFAGATNVRVGFQSSLDAVWSYELARVEAPLGYVNQPMGYQNTALVPRAHARAWNLRGAMEWSHAFGDSRLEAMFAEQSEVLIDSHAQLKGAP